MESKSIEFKSYTNRLKESIKVIVYIKEKYCNEYTKDDEFILENIKQFDFYEGEDYPAFNFKNTYFFSFHAEDSTSTDIIVSANLLDKPIQPISNPILIYLNNKDYVKSNQRGNVIWYIKK